MVLDDPALKVGQLPKYLEQPANADAGDDYGIAERCDEVEVGPALSLVGANSGAPVDYRGVQ